MPLHLAALRRSVLLITAKETQGRHSLGFQRSVLLIAALFASTAFAAEPDPFRRDNLVAWCIVPFDAKHRGPQERVEMLARLGFKKYAYDWRAEHLPTLDDELRLLKEHGIELTAVWFPTELNADAKTILALLEKHGVKTQLWVTGGGGPTNSAEEQQARIAAEANRLRPIAEAAARIGCRVGLYNHGGWFGEPENQLAILDAFQLPNVGLVYNQHHGHDHVGRFAELLAKMKPHLYALNLNGMMPDGERKGQKIIPLGAGNDDLKLLQIIRNSGYAGPIGILGHTNDDAEDRLRDNLDGLAWLLRQREGQPPEPLPKYRTYTPPPPAKEMSQAAPKPVKNHWGKEVVGFDWTEQDSVDDRWSQTDVGPFLASLLPLPGMPPVRKGLTIKLGKDGQHAICYDTEHCSWRAAWTGGFLKFDPARYGLIGPPKIAGELLFSRNDTAGWIADREKRTGLLYLGLQLCGDTVVLETASGETMLRESPAAHATAIGTVFTRDVETEEAGTLDLGTLAKPALLVREPFPTSVEGPTLAMMLSGDPEVSWTTDAKTGSTRVVVPRPENGKPRRFRVSIWLQRDGNTRGAAEVIDKIPPFDWKITQQPAKPRWTKPIITAGKRAPDTAAYVIDSLALPFDNPYHALFFVSGLDFLPNGDLALCTVHGDVWTVHGVDERLERLEWRRFATGLFQPLGLKVVDGMIYVLGRDQITRLRDTNGDGEADRYENFCNAYETSFGGHDYVTCLETDSHGNFYFLHANQGLVRVDRNGPFFSTVATGFRNPNGLGISPGNLATVSPQEGEWTPASSICEIPLDDWFRRPIRHFGYLGPKPDPSRPLGYDPPLCWIPRAVDNSSGGQVWAGEQWGPLSQHMLHLSFGQCRALPVLFDDADPHQAATISAPLNFESGVCRGRVNPRDGNIYVAGLRGWVSSAVQDGCVQRIRYTGRPAGLPVGWRSYANGIELQFSKPIDATAAEDIDSYRVQRWDYRYGKEYGSAEYQDVARGIEGRATVEVLSATRRADGRSVFLELKDLRPAMQYAITGTIRREDSAPLPFAMYPTIHRVPSETVPEQQITRRTRPGQPTAELLAQLRPGVHVKFHQAGNADHRADRLAALHVPVDEAPSLRLSPGPFDAQWDGWIRIPDRAKYSFRVCGDGQAQFVVNGQVLWTGSGHLDKTPPAEVELPSGYHPFVLTYHSPRDAAATLRLMWSGDAFAEEPVPSTVLWHDGSHVPLQNAERIREGHRLYGELRCAACHSDKVNTGPDLTGIGSRVTAEWLSHWLRNPRALRLDATMPRLFMDDAAGRQSAADVAKFLTSLASATSKSNSAPQLSPSSGEALWEDLGCIGCHRFTSASVSDSFGRISLSAAAVKFQPGELAAFLRKPQAHWPTVRMPDFSLSEAEAVALAKWIGENAKSPLSLPAEWHTADAERGRRIIEELRCLNCHQIGEAVPLTRGKAIAPDAVDRGCLAELRSASSRAPQFDLLPDERSALRSFLSQSTSNFNNVPAEQSARLMQRLNCRGCHHRDHDLSPRGELIAEESDRGIPPEAWPNLSWAGEKLHARWLRPFLAGELPERPRPWLKGRMPAFPAYADALTRGLVQEHGVGWAVPTPIEANAEKRDEVVGTAHPTEIGHNLTLALGGLDCRQCHGIAGDLPAGDERTRLARGIDFLVMRDRMRKEHFLRFVLDPPRFDLATRMPKLAADGRTTKITAIYDGDARRQFEAIWEYLISLPVR